MLDAALGGRDIGEFSATTHSGGGGGGRADDMVCEANDRDGRGEKRRWLRSKKWEEVGR